MPDSAHSRVNPRRLTQEKIFENEAVFTTGERRTADPAHHLQVGGLRSRFDFDDPVKRVAVRTIEMKRPRM